ncbi:peptidoglycan editing factor PgeF [Parabacteroides johnsonii]|nr:peptidoglycan editing factor PgeF [Parabacteroides johnsonii]
MKNMKIGMTQKMTIFPNDKVKMLQFPALSEDCNISHFVTTRQGGVSEGAYASFNPGEYSGDNPEAVRANRKLLSDVLGIPSERIFVPFQVHGAEIRSIEPFFLSLPLEEQQLYMHGVDALVTNVPGVCIAVSTADCVPVLLYAPDVKTVAAIHAGWRGTVQRIVAKTVRFLIDEYGADPCLMKAGIAPSIGPDAFEVGEEVVDAFREAGFEMPRILKRNVDTGKAHIDLWEANRLQLLSEGLSTGHIELAGICTYTHPDDFFSARRLGVKSGRILSGIIVK